MILVVVCLDDQGVGPNSGVEGLNGDGINGDGLIGDLREGTRPLVFGRVSDGIPSLKAR